VACLLAVAYLWPVRRRLRDEAIESAAEAGTEAALPS
jgi:hypothetical protein